MPDETGTGRFTGDPATQSIPRGERVTPTAIICGATAAVCVCTLPPHDETTPHECHRPNTVAVPDCNGSWRGTYGTPTFEVIRYPGGYPLSALPPEAR